MKPIKYLILFVALLFLSGCVDDVDYTQLSLEFQTREGCSVDGNVVVYAETTTGYIEVASGETAGHTYDIDKNLVSQYSSLWVRIYGQDRCGTGEFDEGYWEVDSFDLEYDIMPLELSGENLKNGDLILTGGLYYPQGEELVKYVTPDAVESYLDRANIPKNADQKTATNKIYEWFNPYMMYYSDMQLEKEEYFKYPTETLEYRGGDCEDRANALTSLFIAYNSEIKCYSVAMPTHMTNFCKLEDSTLSFVFYEIDHEPIARSVSLNAGELKQQEMVVALLDDYYKIWWNVPASDKVINGVYNDKEYISFYSDEDFVRWATKL